MMFKVFFEVLWCVFICIKNGWLGFVFVEVFVDFYGCEFEGDFVYELVFKVCIGFDFDVIVVVVKVFVVVE